jgi:hypothetical protein
MPVSMIYVDMDGVIANFEKRYVDKFGVTPESTRKNNDFANRFDTFINDGEFATLELMPDAHVLFAYLNSLSIPKEILSSTATPNWHSLVAPQKIVWLNKHNINYAPNLVPGKQHKAKYATPDSVLIDDTPVVIDAWNKAGGIGILHTDAESTIAMLKMYV